MSHHTLIITHYKKLCKTLYKTMPFLLILFVTIAATNRLAEAGICAGCAEFRTDRDSSAAWIRDGDPRQGSPLQKRGTVSSVSWGTNLFATDDRHPIFLDTLVFTGDTNDAGNGVPAGREIRACTLWVTMLSLPSLEPDETIYDLYEVTQSWNENDGNAVSWDNRTNDVAWSTAGVTGVLKLSSALSMKRIAIDTFVWKVSDGTSLILWDTLAIPDGDTLPVPFPLATAKNIYAGTAYGIVLKWASGGESHFYQCGSSENATPTSRPQFQWVHQAVSALPARRRRIIQQMGRRDSPPSIHTERSAK